MFTYCENDPVNRYDDDGYLSASNWGKIAIGAIAFTGAVGLTIATGGSAAIVAASIAKITGGVLLSTLTNAGMGYLFGGKQGAIDGACNGFMLGSISACGGAIIKYSKMQYALSGNSNTMGQAGERLAHIKQGQPKTSISVNGRTRIPDKLTDKILYEVKNVKSISNTQQLKDFAQYANATGRRLVLYVRPTTRVSKAVLNAGWKIKYLW